MNQPNNEFEQKHIDLLKGFASECTLFLKRSNNNFPVKKEEIKKIGLYGNGVRKTLKGGTGSGNVDIHVFKNIEQIFEENGSIVTSKKWLDAYDNDYASNRINFVKYVKKTAKAINVNTSAYSVGMVMPEWENNYNSFINDNEVSLYVISRTSGENHDREQGKGKFSLTDSEIRDIIYLEEHSKKFLLVVNTAFAIDLSPVLDKVNNILLLNYLGSVTSETLYSIVVGESYPSGKLSSTWDKLENYPTLNNFGDINKTEYKEGLYVGYRYFSSYGKKPLFPFGFGISYTNFEIKFQKIENLKSHIKISANVKNIGDFKGKEVVQCYLSKPSNEVIHNPRIELCSYQKSNEVDPGESENIELNFDLADFACYDAGKDEYFLPKGIYLLSIGNSSESLNEIASIEIKENISLRKVKHIDEPDNFNEDLIGNNFTYQKLSQNIEMSKDDFEFEEIEYKKYEVKQNEFVNKLSNEQLYKLCIGNIRGGLLGMIGDSCISLLGGAGESCLTIPGLKNLVMVDGPAGVRIAKKCIDCSGKKYKISTDPIWAELNDYLPSIFVKLVDNSKNEKRKGEIYYQYTTSLPVASALSCSFNDKILEICGEIIKKEMEIFGADIWLAPAINIIRDPRCGRNFEYYSEDPYVTYRCASHIIKGVEENSHKKVCIKHYTCNNQETNRTNNNSIVSIRTLREIYLRVFEKTIFYSKPFSVMTSYNLVNGEHSSESYTLVNDILRNEFKFDGLVITDWISSGDKVDKRGIYPSAFASRDIKAGVNICMPGKKKDIKNIKKALADGYLSIDDIKNNCSVIINKINEVKN